VDLRSDTAMIAKRGAERKDEPLRFHPFVEKGRAPIVTGIVVVLVEGAVRSNRAPCLEPRDSQPRVVSKEAANVLANVRRIDVREVQHYRVAFLVRGTIDTRGCTVEARLQRADHSGPCPRVETGGMNLL